MTPTKPMPRRVRSKSAPADNHQPAGKSANDVRTQHPKLMAKIKAHMDAFKNGDRSEENKAGMKAAMEELQRVKGLGKGCENVPVKVKKKSTRLYEESYTPNEGPVPAVPATKKRSPKANDDETLDTDECKPGKKKAPRNTPDTDGETNSDKPKKPNKEHKFAEEAAADVGDEVQKKKRKNMSPVEVAEDENTDGTKKKKKKVHPCEDDTTPPSVEDGNTDKQKEERRRRKRRLHSVRMTPRRRPRRPRPNTRKQSKMMLALQTRLANVHPPMTKETTMMMWPPIAMAIPARMGKGRNARTKVS